MSNSDDERPKGRGPLLLAAALIATGAGIVAVAVATGALQLGTTGGSGSSAEQSARERCEAEVLEGLMSPSTATLSDVRTEAGHLDVEARDFSPLATSDRLKGIDISRITVLNVSGVVNAATEAGSTIEDHFDCRAYFVDGSLAHTLVVFNRGH